MNGPLRSAVLSTCSTLALLGIVIAAPSAPAAGAPISGPYDIAWDVIAGGGSTFSAGGGYSLGGTIGQHDAGTLSGGAFTLEGGFWAAGATGGSVYLPLIRR